MSHSSSSVRLSTQERIESIKAGLIAAIAGGLTTLFFWSIKITFTDVSLAPESILAIAITIFCAFLFGITYRYIIRQDANPHLRSGALGAFALVRGLSQIEATWGDALPLMSYAAMLGESFGLFAIAKLALDWAIGREFVKPFGAGEELAS
ncbi:MAG: hypothetical protein AAGF01_18125 [Cyanobacteria bacterium P01_G01_bin.38]